MGSVAAVRRTGVRAYSGGGGMASSVRSPRWAGGWPGSLRQWDIRCCEAPGTCGAANSRDWDFVRFLFVAGVWEQEFGWTSQSE